MVRTTRTNVKRRKAIPEAATIATVTSLGTNRDIFGNTKVSSGIKTKGRRS
ncbi:hypothetical protein FAES_0511 [Fibrella aestuarina BUZ 2]|uniref:Uncharacterized protein n=1 Tax=Fibrella aestuarina BUZ 2 TaxID=1166018 RepID=I0K319_9BACT|nr:hypothetical protein FAES_0511 [Fibrella aestuarina BUZ 2]